MSLICSNSAEHRTGPVLGSPFEIPDAITRVKSTFHKSHSGPGSDIFLVGRNTSFCSIAKPMAFRKLLKVSKKHGAEALLEVLKTLPSDLFVDSQGMSSANFIGLVDILSKEFPPTRLVPMICVMQYTVFTFTWYSLVCLKKLLLHLGNSMYKYLRR